jgi:hypothetical protein
MYFELGPTNYSGNILGITTVSVNTTGLVPITASANAQLLPLANGFVSPTLVPNNAISGCPPGTVTIDTGAAQECVTPVADGNTALAGTGSITSGAAILTDSANPFSPAMVGLPITVNGADPSGGTLSSHVLSYQNAGQVTLGDNAGTSVSGETIMIGGNQVGIYAVFSQNHGSGVCVVYNVVNGCGGVTNGTGSFTLANGTATNVYAYNYAQYMMILTSQVSDSNPLVLCSPVGLPQCANADGAGNPNAYIGPDHWEFQDIAPAFAVGAAGSASLILTGPSTPVNATSSCTLQPFAAGCYVNFAHDIHFNGIWPHGDWTSLYTGANSVVNGIDFSGCYYCSATNVQISQSIRPAAEGHCIYAQGNTLKIDNFICEGESSGVFAGGESYVSPWLNYIGNTDIEIRRGDEGFPYPWLGLNDIPSSNPYYTTGKYTYFRKNCMEFKEGARILVDGVWCGDVDNSGQQYGTLLQTGTRNTSGTSALNYNNLTSDVTVTNVYFHDSCNGFVTLGGRSHSTGDGNGITWGQQRFSYSNILGFGISESNPNCSTGKNYGFTADNGTQTWNSVLIGNGTTTTGYAFASVDAGFQLSGACPYGASGCTAEGTAGTTTYYLTGSSSTTSAEALCGGSGMGEYLFVFGFANAGNNSTATAGTPALPVGFPCVGYGTGSTYVVLTNWSGVCEGFASPCGTTAVPSGAFANPILAATLASETAVNGFQVLDIRAGDPVAVTATAPGTTCTAFAPSSGTVTMPGSHVVPNGVGSHASLGSSPWLGSYASWTQAMAEVAYPSSVNATDATGSCLIGDVEGGTEYALVNHVGLVTDAEHPINPLNTPGTTMSAFESNQAYLNSYFFTGSSEAAGSGGWADLNVNSPIEGTHTEWYNYDPATLTTYGLVFPGRPSSDYTEFLNNPLYPESGAGWVGNACSGTITLPSGVVVNGCAPANLYFPASTCGMGFNGSGTWAYGCSGNLVPLTASDYHQFGLQAGSTYSATGAHPSPDGSGDIGPNIPAIDAALTLNQYVCETSCGSPGPFPY